MGRLGCPRQRAAAGRLARSRRRQKKGGVRACPKDCRRRHGSEPARLEPMRDRRLKLLLRRDVLRRPSCRECPLLGPKGKCLDGIHLKSGRCGDWVWFVLRGKQFRRRWVLPRDPATGRQRRWRNRLAAAAKQYSSALSQAQQDSLIAAAAKRRTRRRLGQSGPLTGQQYSVGKQCKAFGRQERRKAIINRAQALHLQALAKVAAAQVRKRQRLTRGTWGQHQGASRYTREHHQPDKRRGSRKRLRNQGSPERAS